MTIEEIKKLSKQTGKAAKDGDMKKLKAIYKKVNAASYHPDSMGGEWFFSMLTADQANELTGVTPPPTPAT